MSQPCTVYTRPEDGGMQLWEKTFSAAMCWKHLQAVLIALVRDERYLLFARMESQRLSTACRPFNRHNLGPRIVLHLALKSFQQARSRPSQL